MLSTSAAHLFKDKYLNSFLSDVPLENQRLRGKRAWEMLTSGKVSLQELPSTEVPTKIQLTMDPLVTWAKAENCQDLTETPGNRCSPLHSATGLGSPHLLCRSCLEDKDFLSCLERDFSAMVQRAWDCMKLIQASASRFHQNQGPTNAPKIPGPS